MRFPHHLLALLAAMAILPMSRAATPEIIDIWPEGVPGLRADAGPEKDLENGRISNIHHPSLTVFRPDKPNGTAAIICPGGAYVRLAFDHEGIAVAHWLNGLGVTAFVLKYRLQEYGAPAPLRDVLRAVRLVRSRAAEFQADPHRVGAVGFSAGGHLVACAGTLFDDPAGRTGNPLDAVSGRPDFLILAYPVITLEPPYDHVVSRHALLGSNPSLAEAARWSPNLHVGSHTPPTFIIASNEDRSVSPENSILFYEALHRAGVPAELHLFEHGPHGFGLGADLGPTSVWPQLAANWLRYNRFLPDNHSSPSLR